MGGPRPPVLSEHPTGTHGQFVVSLQCLKARAREVHTEVQDLVSTRTPILPGTRPCRTLRPEPRGAVMEGRIDGYNDGTCFEVGPSSGVSGTPW